MLRIILTITLSFLVRAGFSQELFKNECDSIRTCSKDNPFIIDVNQKVNKVSSDSLFVFAIYGGISCQTKDLILVYRKNNKCHICYFKNEHVSKNIKLDKKDIELLNSFFEEQLYLTIDTAANNILFIDDGLSYEVMYSIGEHCGTYLCGPAYGNEMAIQIWANKVKLMCWKYKSTK